MLIIVVDRVVNISKKNRLSEVFNPICFFLQISHCIQSRRIPVGTKTGHMAMYEMRGVNKTQIINAHQGRVKALAFGPDGTKDLSTQNSHHTKTSSSSENLGNSIR